jgi:hypothetical protein
MLLDRVKRILRVIHGRTTASLQAHGWDSKAEFVRYLKREHLCKGRGKVMRLKMKFMLLANAAIVLAFGMTAPTLSYAQARDEKNVQANLDFEVRSATLRMISREYDGKVKLSPQALAQAREDFMAIQVVNKNLKQAASGKAALDLKFVSTSAADIKKHAQRLNTNLPLLEPAKDAERQKVVESTNPEELKASALNLTKLIHGFVTNPCFKESAVADAEQARKAKLDLKTIIELSKQLQKDSVKLEKASQNKSP